jgi:prevent-host-death family protein
MDHVGIRELRQNLSVYLRRIAAGETLEVTERGRPVALLTPLPGAPIGPVERLAAQGRVARPAISPRGTMPEPLELPGVDLSAALEEQRADRL